MGRRGASRESCAPGEPPRCRKGTAVPTKGSGAPGICSFGKFRSGISVVRWKSLPDDEQKALPGKRGPRPRLRFPSEHRASYSWLQFSRPSRSHVLNDVTLIIPYWETLYGRAVRKLGF